MSEMWDQSGVAQKTNRDGLSCIDDDPIIWLAPTEVRNDTVGADLGVTHYAVRTADGHLRRCHFLSVRRPTDSYPRSPAPRPSTPKSCAVDIEFAPLSKAPFRTLRSSDATVTGRETSTPSR